MVYELGLPRFMRPFGLGHTFGFVRLVVRHPQKSRLAEVFSSIACGVFCRNILSQYVLEGSSEFL